LSREAVDAKEFWRRYSRNRGAVLGVLLLLGFGFTAIFANIITRFDPLSTRVGPMASPPGEEYWFGTDDLGRDVFSGVVYGTRVSYLVGLAAALGSSVIGVIVGAIAGYRGGRVDDLLMRFTESVMMIPTFVLALLLVAIFGSSIWNIVVVITMLSWPWAARLVRVEFLSLKGREFVEAAKAIGSSDWFIIFREILPNAMMPVIVNASLQVAYAILIEAGLSFLGLGDPNVISWGRMMYDSRELLRFAPWTSLIPGGAVFFMVLSFNLVGDGLNDATNPRLKEGRAK
jgi:peptide/nickel transport system permease protein